jgi:hypothetical protein
VVVLDEGSTDHSHRIVSVFARNMPHNTIVGGDPATNAGCARNRRVTAARRAILIFLDADDRFLKPHIHVCCQVMEDPTVHFVKIGFALDEPVDPEWERRIALCARTRETGQQGLSG